MLQCYNVTRKMETLEKKSSEKKKREKNNSLEKPRNKRNTASFGLAFCCCFRRRNLKLPSYKSKKPQKVTRFFVTGLHSGKNTHIREQVGVCMLGQNVFESGQVAGKGIA